ncbi:MAG: PAS domain S-box protein [Candidatus Latescibacteria bacterium]|nr:PAS domain S-box protein [Candidatus Latescibacterota bacterium]
MHRQKLPADLSKEVARVNALLEEKDRLLAAFHRIGQIILASLDLEQVLDNLAKQVVEAGIFRSLMVALVDEETQSVEVVRSFVCMTAEGVLVPGRSIRSVSLTQNTEGLRYALDDENITAVTARTGKMQIIKDWNEQFGQRVDRSAENCTTKAAYFIPVKRGERVLAVLATGSTPQQLEETLHRIEVMQPLLDQIAIALEHARLYKELQNSEAHYRLLAEHVTDVIWTMDLELHFTYVSPSVRRMRGYTAAEAQAQILEEALTPDSCAKIRQALLEGKEWSEKFVLELEYRCKDGSAVWTETALTFMRQDGKGAILGSSRDISERKRAERELEQQRLLVMRSDRLRSLGERAAGIAHELNQPLVGVRGLAEHLLLGQQRHWNLGEKRMREKVVRIIEQADRMSHIIEHVRMFACEAGRRELHPVDLNEVVCAGTGLLEAQLRSRKLRLVYDLGKELPTVLANPFSLEEVILNLLTNARDAVEERLQQEGRGDRHVMVRTRADGEGGVSLEVVDRGCGISPEVLARIFDPFFTTKEPEKGTGLGLSISRSIVEELGGTMGIESRPGEGTTARVWLPAVRPGSREHGDGGKQAENPAG